MTGNRSDTRGRGGSSRGGQRSGQRAEGRSSGRGGPRRGGGGRGRGRGSDRSSSFRPGTVTPAVLQEIQGPEIDTSVDLNQDAVDNFTALGLSQESAEGAARMGYKEPTEIQAKIIPVLLSGRDAIGCSETGSGKTAAFALPILDMLEEGELPVQVCVLVPTRELCRQVAQSFRSLGAKKRVKVVEIYGGVSYNRQRDGLAAKPQVVVGAPGRVFDLLESRTLDLSGVKFLVLDEADRMLDMGFIPQVRKILEFIPPERITLMFSATIPAEVSRLAKVCLTDPETVRVGTRARPPSQLIQQAIDVMPREKDAKLLEIIEAEPGIILIFTATKAGADQVHRVLKNAGHKACVIHSDRSQNEREASIDGFRAGKYRIMVATDVAQRGLDIEGISLIVNYDLPQNPEDYVHRIGRTGRAQAAGRAVSLVTYMDYSTLKLIERATGHHFSDLDTPARKGSTTPMRSRNLKRKVR